MPITFKYAILDYNIENDFSYPVVFYILYEKIHIRNTRIFNT